MMLTRKAKNYKLKKLMFLMSKLGVFGVFLVLALFSMAFVSAQPPFAEEGGSTFVTGYFIEYTPITIFKINSDIQINAHVFNISNGVRIDNSTTTCVVHLFNQTGFHVINNVNITYDMVGLDWEYVISGGNFTTRGIYAYLITCQDPTNELGGFVAVEMLIFNSGVVLETPQAILYIFLSVFVMLLFCLSLFLTFKTPYSHKVNETGEIIKLTKLKYVKLGFIMLDYILFVWVLNMLIGISENFLTLTLFSGFVGFLFQTLNNLALPFSIFIFVLSLFEIIKDTKIQKIINQLGSYRPKNLK